MRKLVITGKCHPFLADTLRRHGHEVLYDPAISYQQLYEQIQDVEGIVVTTRLVVDRKLLERADKLKWIGRLGSGMELIDVEFALSKNIRCESSPEGNRGAVAEHTLGLLLCLLNNINTSFAEVKKGLWEREKNRGIELTGKTVGIIGFGNTGSSFASLLQPFKLTVLAYDKYKSGFGGDMIKEASLEQIMRYADIISFHVPLTDETLYMADSGFFGALSRKPWLLNTSRGKVVELSSLVQALKLNQVSGAGLDVLENENLASYSIAEKQLLDWLLEQNNVIITPHIAGYSQEASLKMAEVLLQKLGY